MLGKRTSRASKRASFWITLASMSVAVLAGCDKDPTQPTAALSLVGCPTGVLLVNAPINLTFTQDLLPAAVTSANVIVTDATTGFEIPGSVQLAGANKKQVVFTPSSPLPFDERVRVRVQNLLSADGNTSIGVTVCELQTELPPIRELYWRSLPSASGTSLFGVSLVEPTFAYVLALTNTLFRYQDTTAATAIAFPPYYIGSSDVSFVSRTHGFVAVSQSRTRQSYVLETLDGGATFDSIGSVSVSGLNRVYFRATPTEAQPFGVAAGGQSFSPALFLKYHPASRSFTSTSYSGAGAVSDVDFATDTLKGAASTGGLRVGSRKVLGAVFVSGDGGSNWTEVPEARAPDSVLTYRGIAVKSNGEIFVVGGNGYAARLTPNGNGTYAVKQVLMPVTNPDATNPQAFLLTDVEFANADNRIGWIIGGRQSGVVNGVPRYEGLIFMTRDGGTTWTRQGVSDAPNYGAEFPRLFRLDVLSPTAVWAVGDAGVVIRFAGANAR